MELDTLYKRSKTGKIQYWKVAVLALTYPTISKESGQLGTTSPIQHKEEIREGKNFGKANETTPMEQAISQASSDWLKKKDEGYKSEIDLGIGHQKGGVHHGLFTINGVAQVPAKSFEEILDLVLPEFNTDALGNVKPMLATDWNKVKSVQYPVLVQPKLDGVRCLMISDGDTITFLSRSGKEFTTLEHIQLEVLNYILKYENSTPERNVFILDGEIYSNELTFQQIVAAVKKQRPESLKLKFRAYDIISTGTQQERWEATVDLVDKIASPEVQLVPTWVANCKEDVIMHHDTWVQEGYEGAMIRLLNGMYTPGQRSRDLLKVKQFDETEYYFQCWEKGLRDEDLIAVCSTSILADEAKEFKAKMVGTVSEKKELELFPIKVDSLITIKHFGLTEDGLPRFPIGKAFRHDV
ncbi:MAG: hypothetical protein EKK63_02495 [Acinetobacter sp.]|uniref:ATP-dependent DNA ligase n=1 Tax=Acinetobacter sp. TaxID=472 RepID=UPI000FB17998|nr:hypothetical protein [Acinetobacter sp.]RUP42186.1 MAG: hypothetical protein EKK63_02495 [Acinetobacter sp.]